MQLSVTGKQIDVGEALREHVRTSLDGVHFDEKGQKFFRFGFAVDRQSAYVDLGLGIRPLKSLTPPAR